MSTIEPPLVLCDAFTSAYNARLERLNTGIYFDSDKRDEAYRRSKRVERAQVERDRKRISRGYDRAYRERETHEKLRTSRLAWREHLLSIQWFRIRDRVMADRKIRPPGKQPKSVHRWRDQLNAALETDPEYQAYVERRDRFDRLMDRIKCRYPGLVAGVLAVDDRATRHRKVREWRERQGAA